MFVFFELAPGFGDLKLLIKFIDELFYPVFDSKYLEMLLDPGFFLLDDYWGRNLPYYRCPTVLYKGRSLSG